MVISQSTKSLNTIAGNFSRTAIRRYVTNKWILLAAAGLTLVATAAINWSWLVAAGIASVVLSVLPCLVMCGLGLCMHKFVGGRAGSQATGSSAAADGSAVSAEVTAPDSSAAYASSCCAGALHGTSANTPAENTTESKEKTHA